MHDVGFLTMEDARQQRVEIERSNRTEPAIGESDVFGGPYEIVGEQTMGKHEILVGSVQSNEAIGAAPACSNRRRTSGRGLRWRQTRFSPANPNRIQKAK